MLWACYTVMPRIPQGEDVIRESGVPFAVVRPTALTEEDAGAEVVVDQGDVLKVTITAQLALRRMQNVAGVWVAVQHGRSSSNSSSCASAPSVLTAQGKIAREDIAQLAVALLESPEAADTTFEVKSTQPFPEPYKADPSAPSRDWRVRRHQSYGALHVTGIC